MFPLGDMTKEHVRRLAVERGIPSALRRSSAGICFIGARLPIAMTPLYICDVVAFLRIAVRSMMTGSTPRTLAGQKYPGHALLTALVSMLRQEGLWRLHQRLHHSCGGAPRRCGYRRLLGTMPQHAGCHSGPRLGHQRPQGKVRSLSCFQTRAICCSACTHVCASAK